MKRVIFLIAVALGLVSYMLTVPADARDQTMHTTASYVMILVPILFLLRE